MLGFLSNCTSTYGLKNRIGRLRLEYLFRLIGIGLIAIGITGLILKGEGNRGSTRASALAG